MRGDASPGLRGWRSALTRWFRFAPASVWILWALQTGFLVRYLGGRRVVIDSLPAFLLELLLTYVALWVFGALLAVVAPRNRVAAFAVQALFIFLLAFLLLFRWHVGSHFDWTILWTFRRDLLRREVRGMVRAFMGWRSVAFLGVPLGLAAVLEIAGGYVTQAWKPRRRLATAAALAAAAAVLILGPIPSGDELTVSLRSLRGRLALAGRAPADAGLEKYPYVREPAGRDGAPPNPMPNVFIVAIESFNANFAEARTGDGREYTPFFNSLIPKGVYVEGFRSNSMESSRGQLAMLCGIFPNFRDTFRGYQGIRLRCLPEILRERGYLTIFDQGALSLRFEGSGDFMTENGFTFVRAPLDRPAPDRPKDAVWGWGLQDDVLYEEFFEFLDEQEKAAKEKGGPAPRFFGYVPTVSSHFPDNAIPPRLKYLFPGTSGGKSGYANSIHLADRYLHTFFRELEERPYLKNSIVILTGDHSYPAGEHGHTDSLVGYYEELFRTPLLILWPGHLEPRRIRGELWSHLDLPPTILDMLGISVANHFVGRSIFTGADPKRDRVHLIQPYAGMYFAIVGGSLKYVLDVAENREMMFDLARDPHEERDVIDDYRGSAELEDFRRELGRYLLFKRLAEENRVWPPDGEAP